MTLVPLAAHTPATLREALVRRGWDSGRAEAAAQRLIPQTLIFDQLSEQSRDALLSAALSQGLECVSGNDWVLLAGGSARLAGLTERGESALPGDIVEELGRYLQAAVEPAVVWRMSRGSVGLERPVVVGILNVTPDSFSDGGLHLDPARALEHAAALVDAGADMLDVGAESTRPGQPAPVELEEEWRRLRPVLEGLVHGYPDLPLSVDTVKAEIARRALDAGVWAINDVSGLRLDAEIAGVCARYDAGLVLMHSRGSTATMASYDDATYESVTSEVVRELSTAAAQAEERGVLRARLVVDPGFGFSKRPAHNYRVLAELPAVTALGFPVMVGPSRKRFLGEVTGKSGAQRDNATATACAAAHLFGAQLFRVHAVDLVRDALAVAHAVRSA